LATRTRTAPWKNPSPRRIRRRTTLRTANQKRTKAFQISVRKEVTLLLLEVTPNCCLVVEYKPNMEYRIRGGCLASWFDLVCGFYYTSHVPCSKHAPGSALPVPNRHGTGSLPASSLTNRSSKKKHQTQPNTSWSHQQYTWQV